MSLSPQAQRFIEEKIRSGQYESAEAVLEAGVEALRQQELFGDFGEGEMDQLIAEGERSVQSEGTVPANEVFADLRRRSEQRRGAGKRE